MALALRAAGLVPQDIEGHAASGDVVSGLLVLGAVPTGLATSSAFGEALARGLPILASGDGMHALNLALGGRAPVNVTAHGATAGEDQPKTPIFLSPGGKIAHAIGGSGWINIACRHTVGVMQADIADGLLSSAYAKDGVIEAIELPGRRFVLGVQWPIAPGAGMPSGFDNVLEAFLERCTPE